MKEKIVDDNTLIVLNGGFQCLPEMPFWIEKLNDFTEKIPNKVIVLTGVLINDLPVEPKFYFYRINLFDRVSTIYWEMNNRTCFKSYQNLHRYTNRRYKFYWATNNDNFIRRFILDGLRAENLIENNLISYKCGISSTSDYNRLCIFNEEDRKIILQSKLQTDNIVPLPAIDNTVEFNETPLEFLKDSYLHICLDTFYTGGIFLSEKIFNAMNHYQLFFYLGEYNSLNYLKTKGYELFDDLIDLSYDSIQDPGERLKLAKQSLLNYLTKPIEDIHEDYIKSIPKILHNKNLVVKQRPDLELKDYFFQVYNDK